MNVVSIIDDQSVKIASKKSERKVNSKDKLLLVYFEENYFRKIAGNKRGKSAELHSKKL